MQYKIQGGAYNHTTALYEPINIERSSSSSSEIQRSFELTNEMLGLSLGPKKNGHSAAEDKDKDNKRMSADTHFTRDTHMRIILGNSAAAIGRSVKHATE